jgi:hypothetical protein
MGQATSFGTGRAMMMRTIVELSEVIGALIRSGDIGKDRALISISPSASTWRR